MFLVNSTICVKLYPLFTFMMPTSPPARHENTTSSKKDKSIENVFANIEKLTKATKIYNSPKQTPLTSPFDSPLIAIELPTKTLMVLIARFNEVMYFSLNENHFKQNANKIISPKEISIETINPFKKFNNKLLLNLSDFAKDIILPLIKCMI